MATRNLVPRADNEGGIGTAAKKWASAYIKKWFFSAAPAADTYEGIVVTATAHENVILGSLCFVNSDGEMAKTDADAAATMPGLYMATASISADASGTFLRSGIIHLNTLAPGWTKGALIYAGTDAGSITATQPSGSGDQVQIIGVALAADILDFNPCPIVIEVA